MARNVTPFQPEDLKNIQIYSSGYEPQIKNKILHQLIQIFEEENPDNLLKFTAHPEFQLTHGDKKKIADLLKNHEYYNALSEFFTRWTGKAGNGAVIGNILFVLVEMRWQSAIDEILKTPWNGIIGIPIQISSTDEMPKCTAKSVTPQMPKGQDLNGIISVPEVTKVLTEDDNLVDKWIEFRDALEIQPRDAQPWAIAYRQQNMQVYELFSKLLSSWKGSKGSDATIEKLCSVLESVGAKGTAEKLKLGEH